MKILLRHTETGLYLQGPDRWTSTPEIAFDFRFIDRAHQFMRTWELDKVAIVFAFEDAQIMSPMTREPGVIQEQLSAAALG